LTDVKENKGFVTAEYLKKIAKERKQIKSRIYELMQIHPDSKVLDIGCGPAIDTIPMSEFIGVSGCIVGVDNDPAMIEKADLEAKQQGITKCLRHMQASAHSMPFGDGEFDRVHAERLFQVLPQSVNPKLVFAEMNRVLRSNGRVVLADADWGTASVNFSDNELERRLLTFFAAKLRPNGFAGRQLFELLKNGGYGDLTVEVIPVLTWDFSETPFAEWLPTEALKSGVATQKEIDRWKAELASKTAQGTYLSYINMVIVCGAKK
jgi:ubiquinone/menaquinone biosynthesis C-methylase UbiE